MPEPFQFTVGGYAGSEEAILEIRNRNRRAAVSREYLDWRYIGEKNAPPPVVFWVVDASGDRVGMASLIFRAYSVAGVRAHFPVLGDISLDAAARGRGISSALFREIARHVADRRLPCGLVMPNPAAERGLKSAGWEPLATLTPMVLLLSPARKIRRLIPIPLAARFGDALSRRVIRSRISKTARLGVEIGEAREFDPEFNEFWARIPKAGAILRVRDAATLDWRYRQRPGPAFSIRTFRRDGRMAGYAVLLTTHSDGICAVYDFLVGDPALLTACAAALIEDTCRDPHAQTIRIPATPGTPLFTALAELGFRARQPVIPTLVCGATQPLLRDASAWMVADGDKDA